MVHATRSAMILVLTTVILSGCSTAATTAEQDARNTLVAAVEEGAIAQEAAAYCESIWETDSQIVAAFDSDVDEVRSLGWVPGAVSGFEEDLPPTRGTYLAVCIYDVADQPGTVEGSTFRAYWAGTDGNRGGMSSIAEW